MRNANRDGESPLLAAVIIARNEERYVEACISSVVEATRQIGDCDVVLVDSSSSDRTCEIARSFPIRTIELRQSPVLSPALARRVGQRLTGSRYVMFVDGDTQIEPGWLAAALAALEGDPRVAGVGGKLRELYFVDGRLVGENPDCFDTGDTAADVEQLGGNALYRREALDAVGSFNPYLSSYEETELAERLRRDGYRVMRLPVAMGTHRTGPVGSHSELRRRYRERLMHGHGQVLRLAVRDGLFRVHARRLRRYLEFIGLCAAGIGCAIASLVTFDLVYVSMWLALCVALLGVFVARSRSVTKPLSLILEWAYCTVPLLVGFARTPPDPERFDPNAFVIPARCAPAAAHPARPVRSVGSVGLGAVRTS